MSRISQIILTGTTNVTSLMSGTTADFSYEVIEVYVNGVITAFTWADGVLTIGGYTTGTVLVDYNLYLISGSLSKYLPKDPTDDMSDVVFWESRVIKYPIVSTSMKNLFSGITSSAISNLAFNYRGGWDNLATLDTYFVNKPIIIYRNGAVLFIGKTDGSSTNSGVYTVTLSNIEEGLDKECTFGDPDYLNRIDLTSSNGFYTGSSIDDKYDGNVIPLIVGPRSPWEDKEAGNVYNGEYTQALPPLTLPPVNTLTRTVGTGFILKVIPISSTVGILCRTPSFQSLQSLPQLEPLSFANVREFTNLTGESNITNVIESQLVSMNQGSDGGGPTLGTQAGRIIHMKGFLSIALTLEDTSTAQYASYDYDSKSHLCSNSAPNGNFNGTPSISSQATPGGNTLWKITVSGLDLQDGNDYFYVCTDITGARSAPKVAEYILDSNGFTTDSSFDTVGAALPTVATMQIGVASNMPTVNQVLSEINQSTLCIIKKNLDSDTYSMQKVDLDPTTTVTVDDSSIAQVTTTETSNASYGRVEFEPKYLRGSRIRDQVYTSGRSTTFQPVLGLSKTRVINHCMNVTNSRFDDIIEFWARPDKTVGFVLLDETIIINIGDYVQVNHDNFTGKIIVTKITPRQLGYGITGRKV